MRRRRMLPKGRTLVYAATGTSLRDEFKASCTGSIRPHTIPGLLCTLPLVLPFSFYYYYFVLHSRLYPVHLFFFFEKGIEMKLRPHALVA